MRLLHSNVNVFCLVEKKEYILLSYMILTSLSNVSILESWVYVSHVWIYLVFLIVCVLWRYTYTFGYTYIYYSFLNQFYNLLVPLLINDLNKIFYTYLWKIMSHDFIFLKITV